jgi:putative peptide zinc metalloprotease protein
MHPVLSSEQLAPAAGLELLGAVPGSGYENGAALVRRADGQTVQLGPLMYALLEELDGHRDSTELSEAMCDKLGRACDERHVEAIAQKLAEQGLIAGSEANAPERVSPLFALRWKIVVTDPELTRRLTAPFAVLFRPTVVGLVLLAFLAVCWFVLIEKGVASAAAQAFDNPELILLVFVLGIASAGFHELGHASACRYGGGTPGAMGAGIYLVWPAFYTDVSDAYRLPTKARLRTDFGGLYFNSVIAVVTLVVWSLLRVDALLLVIGLQLLEMVKQLSPVIRADGYHILADATGVPDLYAHIGPTLKRLVPGHARQPSALTGRARVLVTGWVLVVVPILLAMALGAILVLPKLLASTWVSGSHLLGGVPAQMDSADLVGVLVTLLRLSALALPLIGTVLITRRIVLGVGGAAVAWSRGRPARKVLVGALATGLACAAALAWWPAGQYEPIRADDRGRLIDLTQLARHERPAPVAPKASAATAKPNISPGKHLAISLIPSGGATEDNPAIFVITDPGGSADPVIITSAQAPAPTDTGDPDATAVAPGASADPASTSTATAITIALPEKTGANDSQTLAV